MQGSPLDFSFDPSLNGATSLEGLQIVDNGSGPQVRSTSRQFVRFYKKIEPEIVTTEVKVNPRTGEVIPLRREVKQVEKEFVLVVNPGDKNKFDGVAEPHHKREFFRHYQAFRDGRTAPLGKDLDECTYVSSAIATELKYHGCHTEEQLADASDVLCDQIADGWQLREMARAMVSAGRKSESLAQVNALKAELEKSQSVIAQMQEQIGEMKGLLLNAKGKPIKRKDEEPAE